MPSAATVFFLSSDKAAKNQPITFTFNTTDFPTATSIKWTFPDNTVLEGPVVSCGIASTGTKTVVLSAVVDGTAKSWNIEVEIRDHVVYTNDLVASAAYNGFKGSYPVFSPDGKTVYDITFSGTTSLYAWDIATGAEKWHFTPSTVASSYNPLTVNPVSGDIYFGTTTGGQFYCVDDSGSQKWMFTGAGSCQSTAPAVSKDGSVVYLGDASGHLFAIDAASGTQKWKTSAGAKVGCLAVYKDYVIAGVVASSNNLTFFKASDGSSDTVLSLNANVTDIAGFAVSADHTILYVPHQAGALSSVSLTEKKVLVNAFAVSANNNYQPVTLPNGNVFFGSKDSAVYCVDKDLTTVVWKYAYLNGTNNAFNYSHPASDTDNNVYISAGQVQNQNFVFGPDGAIKQQWQYDGAGNKQMGGNNYLDGVMYSAFIGATGANGLFAGDYVGGTRYSGPNFDICGSGCIE